MMKHFPEKASDNLNKILLLNRKDSKDNSEMFIRRKDTFKKSNLHESFIILCEINLNINQWKCFKVLERFKFRFSKAGKIPEIERSELCWMSSNIVNESFEIRFDIKRQSTFVWIWKFDFADSMSRRWILRHIKQFCVYWMSRWLQEITLWDFYD